MRERERSVAPHEEPSISREVLSKVGHEILAAVVVEALPHLPDEVRHRILARIIDSMGRGGSESTAPIVVVQDEVEAIAQLSSPDSARQGAAAESQGAAHEQGTVAALSAALRDENVDVRRAAARALGEMGGVSAIAALRVRVGFLSGGTYEEDESLAEEIEQILERLEGEQT